MVKAKDNVCGVYTPKDFVWIACVLTKLNFFRKFPMRVFCERGFFVKNDETNELFVLRKAKAGQLAKPTQNFA